jgi:hypothetical protein
MPRRAFSKYTRPEAVRISLGFAAFVIYALASLFAHQNLSNDSWRSYALERTGMASAISHMVYGAPVATVYRNLFNSFEFSSSPLGLLIDQAKHKQIEPGELLPYVPDGIGMGQAVFTTVAMKIFGINPRAIVVLFLILMGVTTLAFLARFPDGRSVAILSVFLTLTVMLASPLGTTTEGVSQVPVGGYRYFGLLAVMPCLHVCLELLDSTQLRRLTRAEIWLLAIQVLVFAISYLTNLASVYVYGLVLLVAAYTFVATRRLVGGRGLLFRKVIIVAEMIGSILLVYVLVTPQAYRVTGRAGVETTWHHVIIGFGANPNWPFGALAGEYRGCWPGKPNDSLVPGLSDFNGGCFWAAYAKQHGLSDNQMGDELYDKEFNVATREAVFKIVEAYPSQAFITFIYYKPLLTLRTLASYFDFRVPWAWPVSVLIVCQAALFMFFSTSNRHWLSFRAMRPVYAIFGLGILATSGMYVVAYSTLFTTTDLFFYVLVLIATSASGIAAQVAQWIWPTEPSLVEVGGELPAER